MDWKQRKSLKLIPTSRALALLLAAAPFLAASNLLPLSLYVGLLVLVAAVALMIADVWMSPRPADFEVARIHDTKLSLGADNRIEIVVRSRAARDVEIQVRDELPARLIVKKGQRVLTAQLPERDHVTLAYHVHPLHRGDYDFGDLNLRWSGALGLFRFQATYPARAPVQVYPNLLKLRTYDLLIRRSQVQEIGLRSVRRFGEGGEFEQLRDYAPDDDYRRIAWKATARYAKPITMEFQAERSQNIIIAIDLGRQMMARSATTGLARLDVVVNATLLFSYVAAQFGDRIGVLTFADDVFTHLAPRAGRRQFLRILECLYRVQAQPVEPDYGRALRFLKSKQQRRALIVLFTDPSSDQAAQTLTTYLGALCPRHLPFCVTLGDPNVVSAASRTPGDVTEVYERVVAQQMLDERQVWLKKLQRRGVLTLDVRPAHLTPKVINKYLEIKARGRI